MIKCVVEKQGFAPVKAHNTDAGFDLYTPIDFYVNGGKYGKVGASAGSYTVDAKVHIAVPEGYCGLIVSKSGLNVNKGLTATGLIDSGYTGSIKIKLYNHTYEKVEFERGDKIAQLVFLPIHSCNDLEIVDELDETDRGDNGFGSTGR